MSKVFCGIDFHKRTSTIFSTDEQGKQVESATISTPKLRSFLSNRKNWQIAIEASGGTNHVVSQLREDGHTITLINPNQFRGIGIGGKKTDERDAKALAQALRVGFIPEVHLKSLRSRQIKSLLTSREIFVRTRTALINHLRATLREYGITMPAGAENFYALASSHIEMINFLPIKETLKLMFVEIKTCFDNEKKIEKELENYCKDDDKVKRLMTIPGVGPMSAYSLISVTDDISRFKSADQFSAYLGLTPSVTASADKCMMGSITRSGPEMTRRYLVHGARAWFRYSPEKSGDRNRIWAEKVKGRRGMNKAIVALARRIARIAFAVLRDGTEYGKKQLPLKLDSNTPVANTQKTAA